MTKTLEQLRAAMQIFANNGTVNLSVVRLREWIEALDQHITRAPLQNGGAAGDEVARDVVRLEWLIGHIPGSELADAFGIVRTQMQKDHGFTIKEARAYIDAASPRLTPSTKRAQGNHHEGS